jgi:gas vesicle protein
VPAERGGGQFIAGLLTGALVGASLAMVFSPVAGGDVRDMLQAKADDIRESAVDALDAGKQ